jgi:hypothetical protein
VLENLKSPSLDLLGKNNKISCFVPKNQSIINMGQTMIPLDGEEFVKNLTPTQKRDKIFYLIISQEIDEIERILFFLSKEIERNDENYSEELTNFLENEELMFREIDVLELIFLILESLTSDELKQYLILIYDCFFILFDEFYIELIKILSNQMEFELKEI